MLHPNALEISWWKKKPVAWVYENHHLKHARCLHATSESEAHFIRKYGIKNPICIIPNGIHLPRLVEGTPRPRKAGKKVLLYLGRLHPQKGLLTLLHAWAAVQGSGIPETKEWVLVIAGWAQHGHEGELKIFCQQHSLCNTVSFAGPQFGEAKDQIYRSADAFVLPSSFESFGMVVLEAWSHGLPVLMTNQGYLTEGFASDAALPMEFSFEGMVDGLHTLCSMSDQQRQDMGRRGLDLVEKQFTWNRNATSMRSVYEWMLGGGPTPNCII
jgi:poly(glycerol-phosphate) alpha-glucosyltransferase